MKFFLRTLMFLYLLVLVGFCAWLWFDTGQSWWLTLFLFSPRWVLALPLLLLVPLTGWFCPRSLVWYALHLLILVVPLGGFCIPPIGSTDQPEHGRRFRLLTCNLGAGPIDIDRLVALIEQHQCDVVCLQECGPAIVQELQSRLPWDYKRDAGLVICSPHTLGAPIVLARYGPEYWNVAAAIAVEIPWEGPADTLEQPATLTKKTTLRIACIHLPTFRPAFEKARNFDSSAQLDFVEVAKLYRQLASQASSALRDSTLPTVCGGDFNVPIESAFYRDYWSSYQNALSQHGFGWCHTKHTRWHGVRIDHVLADSRWTIESAQVGPDLGGDHRPVLVELNLQ